MVGNNKLPENAVNAVKRAQNIAGSLKTMNREIPLEQHAYVMMSDSVRVNGLLGSIGVFPTGSHDVQLESRYGIVHNEKTNNKNFTLSVSAGMYYSFEINKISTNLSSILGNIELVTAYHDEEKLNRAKQDVAGIKEYLEYKKYHPNALDGTYKDNRGSTLIIEENQIYFSVIKGMEILYDKETIVLIGDGKYKFNDYLSDIWYYRFNDDGNLEIILNAYRILSPGPNNIIVFKPVQKN